MSLKLNREETSLMMIDIQERLLPSIHEHEAVTQNAVRLLKAAEVLSLPVLYTEQYVKGLGSTVEEVRSALPEEARRFEKLSFSCCDEPGFFKVLQQTMRSTIVLFGTESHVCVLSTAEDLFDRGWKIMVAADACGSRAPENHLMAMETLRSHKALILPTETIVYRLLRRAGTPEFKAMLPLFK
jgi:nicotinamidase-related amidase